MNTENDIILLIKSVNNNSKDLPIVGGIKFRLVYEIKCGRTQKQ